MCVPRSHLCSIGKVRSLPSAGRQNRQTRDGRPDRGDPSGKTKIVLGTP